MWTAAEIGTARLRLILFRAKSAQGVAASRLSLAKSLGFLTSPTLHSFLPFLIVLLLFLLVPPHSLLNLLHCLLVRLPVLLASRLEDGAEQRGEQQRLVAGSGADL